jgi:phospholipid/cholesterol/gamma-HCH transport system substrate-binding protein
MIMLMNFRVRHFERFVGIFIVLALTLAVLALIFTGRGQHWFAKRSHYTVVFHKVQGLKMGTPVTISGMEVGSVQSLRLTPQSMVELTLEVLQTYQEQIRKDSQATIASSLIGGKTVEITAGSPDQPPLSSGSTLPSQEPKELTDLLKDIDVKAPLKKLDDALENIRSITQKLNNPDGDLFTLLRNVEFVTGQWKKGQGAVGGILQDKKLHGDVSAAVESARRSAANLEETTGNAAKVSRELSKMVGEIDRTVKEIPLIVDDVKRTTAGLPQVMGKVQKAADDAPAITGNLKEITQDVKIITGNVKKASPEVPDLVATTQDSVEEAEKLLRGLQQHWLLRGSMPKSTEETPAAVRQRESPYEPKGEVSR